MKIEDLTLNTIVKHHYYGNGTILNIEKDKIKVKFKCKYFNTNEFTLTFITQEDWYHHKDCRNINELSIK